MEQERTRMEQLQGYRRLVRSPEWAELGDILRAQAEARTTLLSGPLKSTEQLYEQEFQKGERAGILLVLGLLPSMIESMEYEIALEKQNETSADGQHA